ncbi:MAG: tRNA (N6-isopentenyl adenosine(37)-C2)-methylthiotransferase MiaB [bacterium]
MKGLYEIVTFGCQMNEADSEAMAGLLEESGYAPAGDERPADVILLNTCAVRDHAEEKAYSHLGEHLADKRNGAASIVGFTGCVAQKEGEKLLERFPDLDLVLGPGSLTHLPGFLEEINENNKRIVATGEDKEMVSSSTPRRRRQGRQASVTIMTGCDKFCSYCIVPHTRGREESRPPEDILAEIKELAGRGYREITLLGQSVNNYGSDLDGPINFVNLLRRIDEIDGDFRLRFTSPHPAETTSELIECYDELDVLAANLHLPVQSGSNSVLKKMNRHYTREDFLQIVEEIRNLSRYVTVSTDVIVGFPGETEEDFAETVDLFRQVGFNKAYIYKYSPRSGTRAAEMEDTVPAEEISRRHSRLLELNDRLAREVNQKLVGQTQEVFVEGHSPKSNSSRPQFTGRTSTNDVVVFDALPEKYIGELIPVKITKADSYTLFGEVNADELSELSPAVEVT